MNVTISGTNNDVILKWNSDVPKTNDIYVGGTNNTETYEISQDIDSLTISGTNNDIILDSIYVLDKRIIGKNNDITFRQNIKREIKKEKNDFENMSDEELDSYIKDKGAVDEAFKRLEEKK